MQPSIDAEAHYVTNPTNAPSGSTTSDVYLVGRPRLALELSSSMYELGFAGDIEYRRYLGLVEEYTTDLSVFAAHLGGNLHVNKDGPLALRLRDTFTRDGDLENQSVLAPLFHTSNDFGVGVDMTPGGGALRLSADYQLRYDYYDRDQDAAATPEAFDYIRHDPSLTATWKFLPRTAIMAEARGVITTYPGGAYGDPGVGAVETPSSKMLLTYVGLVGALSAHLNGLLKAGYGDTFTTPDRFRSIVAQAELTYAVGDTTQIRAGYVRTVSPTVLYRYVGIDKPYLRFHQLLFGRTTIGAEAEYSMLRFGERVGGMDAGRREDQSLAGSLSVEQQLGRWLRIALVDRAERRSTSMTTSDGSLDYFRNDIFLRLSIDIDEVASVAN